MYKYRHPSIYASGLNVRRSVMKFIFMSIIQSVAENFLDKEFDILRLTFLCGYLCFFCLTIFSEEKISLACEFLVSCDQWLRANKRNLNMLIKASFNFIS